MAARTKKLRRPFGGNRNNLPPEEFVLFLDENLHNCQPILDVLSAAEIHCERHVDHFAPGTPDNEWLPYVGQRGWVLLNQDRRIRYNELEKRALLRFRLRVFVYTSGTQSGKEMAETLRLALPKLRRVCRKSTGPFIASITKSGTVQIKFGR